MVAALSLASANFDSWVSGHSGNAQMFPRVEIKR